MSRKARGNGTSLTFTAKFGGLFLFNYNYDANDLRVPSLFYSQLLTWWSEFREDFASPKDWHNMIRNNRDIRIVL